jgi:zinc and cadmium transporter
MTHNRTQMVLSLISGLMLGVALLHLIPHAFVAAGAIDTVMIWTLSGLIFMLLLLRWFHFHQHDFASAAADCDLTSPDEHYHAHAHAHDHAHLPEQAMGALGLFAGLCVHTVVDGIALGAVLIGSVSGATLAGVGVFLAILLHKPLDALSIETVMGARGWSSLSRWSAAIVFALLCPLAAALFYFGATSLAPHEGLLPAALAFAAGAFICIALGDLLPEVQFHSHDRLRLTLLFLLGVGIAFALGLLEPAH